MSYESLKALLEANRKEPAVQRNSKLEEFPKSDSRPDRKDLDDVGKGRKAA